MPLRFAAHPATQVVFPLFVEKVLSGTLIFDRKIVDVLAQAAPVFRLRRGLEGTVADQGGK